MSAPLEGRGKLSLAQKIGRFADRMRDPQWRRYGKTLLLGKMLGLAALPIVIMAVQLVVNLVSVGVAHADDAAATPITAADLVDMAKNPVINPLNTAGCSSAPSSSSGCRRASRCSRPGSAGTARR